MFLCEHLCAFVCESCVCDCVYECVCLRVYVCVCLYLGCLNIFAAFVYDCVQFGVNGVCMYKDEFSMYDVRV